MEKIRQLQNEAIRWGATTAKVIPISSIVVDERVRLKCLVPLCDKYNQNLMCPPVSLRWRSFENLLKNIPKRCLSN
jgi:predicted metal-binding protein